MSKFIEFFQGSNGDMSSKRLGYLLTIPFSLIGTMYKGRTIQEPIKKRK